MLISIVTINLNNLAGLQKTMASVFSQTYGNVEYIVIDGGSTDGSKEFLQKYPKHFQWVSEPDKGVYAAQNKGWKLSKAPYLLFLNSGDTFYDSQSLDHLAKGMMGEEKIVYGNMLVEDQGGEKWVKNYPDTLLPDYFERNTLPHPGTLMARVWLEETGGYDENLKICSDWKFFRTVFFRSPGSFSHINETVCCFARDGMSSLRENRSLIKKEKALEFQRLPFRQLPKQSIFQKLKDMVTSFR